MNLRILVLTILVIPLLAGCKITIELPLSLNDLLTADTKNLSGNLYLEIPSCHSYEDSRKLSTSVLEAQQNIPLIFEGAQYTDCFSKNFDSFAQFTIPVILDKTDDGKLASNQYINLISNERQILSVAIPTVIKNNLNNFEQRNFGTSFEVDVQVKLKNDTGKDIPVNVMASYVDEQPYLFSSKTLLKGKEVTVRLSDVATDNALQNVHTPLLLPIEK